jgi:hypothetical protein
VIEVGLDQWIPNERRSSQIAGRERARKRMRRDEHHIPGLLRGDAEANVLGALLRRICQTDRCKRAAETLVQAIRTRRPGCAPEQVHQDDLGRGRVSPVHGRRGVIACPMGGTGRAKTRARDVQSRAPVQRLQKPEKGALGRAGPLQQPPPDPRQWRCPAPSHAPFLPSDTHSKLARRPPRFRTSKIVLSRNPGFRGKSSYPGSNRGHGNEPLHKHGQNPA